MSALVRAAWTVAVTAVAAAAGMLGAFPASAATSCRVVQVQNAVPVGIALSPDKSTVPYGGCVQFSDQAFGPDVTITVAGGYHVTLTFGGNTAGKTNYAATSPGDHAVKADNGTSTASGRITVGPAPSRSPSASRSPSPAPRPSPSAAASQSSGPQVAPTPRQHRPPPPAPPLAGSPPPFPSLQPTPGVAPSVAGSPPGPLQSTTPAAVVGAGPLEPPSGRSLGLPAALAALVLLGVGTAVVRVVLAEPAVDNRRSVGRTA